VAKQTGITATLTIGGTSIATAVSDFSLGQSRAQIDVTGIDKDFFERLPGLGDWSFSCNGTFDTATSHAVFSAMGTALKAISLSFSNGGTANGTAALVSYNVTRAQGGGATYTAQLDCANGTGIVWS
jgi:hypothetical protein